MSGEGSPGIFVDAFSFHVKKHLPHCARSRLEALAPPRDLRRAVEAESPPSRREFFTARRIGPRTSLCGRMMTMGMRIDGGAMGMGLIPNLALKAISRHRYGGINPDLFRPFSDRAHKVKTWGK